MQNRRKQRCGMRALILFPFSMSRTTTPFDQHANVIPNYQTTKRTGGHTHTHAPRWPSLLLHLSFIFSSISTTTSTRRRGMCPCPPNVSLVQLVLSQSSLWSGQVQSSLNKSTAFISVTDKYRPSLAEQFENFDQSQPVAFKIQIVPMNLIY